MRACRNAMLPGSTSRTTPRRTNSSGHSSSPAMVTTSSGSNACPATRAAVLVGQPVGPQQHGVPHVLGQREIFPFEQLQTQWALLEPSAGGQRQSEFLDEEGDTIGRLQQGPLGLE